MPYASWGIGISEGSKHKEEAWKLVEYLMSPDVNGRLVSIANAFPGNVHAKPDFVANRTRFSRKLSKSSRAAILPTNSSVFRLPKS
jgi:multiple sugar transport system substrate-binding protein